MTASYRLGLLIVVVTVLGSLGFILAAQATGRLDAAPRPAGQDLDDTGYDLGRYRLVERSGRAITEVDLAGDVWVAAFVFTRCPSSCPRISSVMRSLQPRLNAAGVKLASISVDPNHDTPEVLARYAQKLDAPADGWWFLTGREPEVYDLILRRFHLSVAAADPGEATRAGAEAIAHSDRLVLVDRGNHVVGVFDSTDAQAQADLVAKATRLGSWARRLPPVNAALNGLCAGLLLIGWGMILTNRARGHAACMISAVVVSAVFLGCYLVYHSQAGSVSFRGTGGLKVVYLTILLSHTLLATLGVVPLVVGTLSRAWRRRFHAHARIAQVTFPIWLYVSVTGVVIYWMLYQMPIAPTSI